MESSLSTIMADQINELFIYKEKNKILEKKVARQQVQLELDENISVFYSDSMRSLVRLVLIYE